MLSPRLQLKVSQKQILTPGLVQMVTVLQLNRLELKDMITQEIAENPVLEESVDGIEELTPEEVQAILEAERDLRALRSDHSRDREWGAGAGARDRRRKFRKRRAAAVDFEPRRRACGWHVSWIGRGRRASAGGGDRRAENR